MKGSSQFGSFSLDMAVGESRSSGKGLSDDQLDIGDRSRPISSETRDRIISKAFARFYLLLLFSFLPAESLIIVIGHGSAASPTA